MFTAIWVRVALQVEVLAIPLHVARPAEIGVMAEHESRLISERTKAAMAAAKARGATFGASPATLARATAASLRARQLRASNSEPKSA